MKFIKYTFISLFLVITIYACNKEEVTAKIQTQNKIQVDENRVVFDTYLDYENHIEDYQTSEEPEKFILDFKNQFNFAQSSSRGSLPDSLKDEFLESILNQDRIVQIGDFLYRVNMITGKVYVLDVANISEYQDLVAENVSNLSIREFSTGDDVIDLVEGIGDNVSRGCGGIGGGFYQKSMNLGKIDNVVVTMKASVRFFRGGIYFRLTGIVNYTPTLYSGTGLVKSALYMKSPGFWAKKRPCRNKEIRIVNSGYILKWGNDHTRVSVLYVGTRNLNGYHLFVRARGALVTPDGNWYGLQNSDYAGRNVNSPW